MSPSWSPPAGEIRILVVDDSVIVRKTLSLILEREADMRVMGAAKGGAEAIEIVKHDRPDIVLLDVIMPGINGLETLVELRKIDSTLPIIMFSSVTQEGAAVTVEALSKGASDFVGKPSGGLSTTDTIDTIRKALVPKIRMHHLNHLTGGVVPARKATPLSQEQAPFLRTRPRVVAIGVSTGGPAALDVLITRLPADFPVPIVIVQHMPAVFTKVLAERLDSRSQIQVLEAYDGLQMRPGLAVIARGDRHMTV